MKKLSLFFIVTIFSLLATAQTQMKYWSLPSNKIDMATGNISSLPATNSSMGSNMAYDKAGNLVFYISGTEIIDANGNILYDFYFSNFTASIASTAEVAIVPFPDECNNKYYIIVSEVSYISSATERGDTYAFVIDFNQESDRVPGVNGLITSGQHLSGFNNTGYHWNLNQIAITPLIISSSGNYYFLYTFNRDGIKKFIIDGNGITIDQNFNYSSYYIKLYGNLIYAEGEIVKIGDNYKLAFVGSNPMPSIHLFDLNSSGNITGYNEIAPIQYNSSISTITPDITGLEFSQDGSLLYFTAVAEYNNNTNLGPLNYIDLSTLAYNELAVTNSLDFKNGFIELGYDGKLYFAANNRLGTLSNSNSPTSIWNDNAIQIGITSVSPSAGFSYYLLPDQIDGQNYNDIITTGYHVSGNIDITTSGTWTPANNPFQIGATDIYIDGNITFKAGVNVIISGMNFYFTHNKKIFIENGTGNVLSAKLTIYNSKLAADDKCENTIMWGGVEVWGNYASSSIAPQGRFTASNGSVIEDAYTAVQAGKNSIFTRFNPGGLITIENSTIRNCQRGLYFYPYKHKNYSKIVNSEFIIDKALNDPAIEPVSMIEMYRVNGIYIYQTDFSNNQQFLPAQALSYNGIVSNTAAYRVTNSSFNNLRYGINSRTANPMVTVTIEDNVFNENHFGAYLGGLNFARINKNTFNIFNPVFFSLYYGLYLEECTRYQVEENKFYGDNMNFQLGAIINNSNVPDVKAHHKIYNNYLQDLHLGFYSLGNNRGGGNRAFGLQILCNKHSNNLIDHLVVPGNNLGTITGIANVQGTDGTIAQDAIPAGNWFSQTCSSPNPENDYWQDASTLGPQDFNYYHHSDGITTPQCYTVTEILAKNVGFTFDEEKDCLSTFGESENIFGKISLFNGKREEFINLIDGGDTEGVLSDIENMTETALENELLSFSPYLSDEALEAMLDRYPSISENTVANIIIANSPVTSVIFSRIEGLYPELSSSIMDEILGAQEGTSGRFKLESQIAWANLWLNRYVSDLIHQYNNNDSVTGAIDSVQYYLNLINNDLSKAGSYIIAGDSSSSNMAINALIESGQVEWADLYSFQVQMMDSTSFANATELQLDPIKEIINNKIGPVANAKAILGLARDTVFWEYLEFNEIYHKRSNEKLLQEMPKGSKFKLYPNPASSQISVEFFNDPESIEQIEIIDLNGRRIGHISVANRITSIETRNFTNGIYLLRVRNNTGEIIESKTFIISR